MLVTSLKVQTPPAEEPVTLAEAKAHMRIVVNDDDALITRLIAVARQQCEYVARRAFVSRTYDGVLDKWPRGDTIKLPYPPLVSVTSITYIDSAGDSHTMPSSDYFLDTTSEPGRIHLAYNASWPAEILRPHAAITIRFVAGYGGAASVPDGYKQATLLYLAHLYENREAVLVQQGITALPVPMAIESLLLTDRGNW